MRPIFHFTERRIEAHICICFVAYKVYKELERLTDPNAMAGGVLDTVPSQAPNFVHDYYDYMKMLPLITEVGGCLVCRFEVLQITIPIRSCTATVN